MTRNISIPEDIWYTIVRCHLSMGSLVATCKVNKQLQMVTSPVLRYIFTSMQAMSIDPRIAWQERMNLRSELLSLVIMDMPFTLGVLDAYTFPVPNVAPVITNIWYKAHTTLGAQLMKRPNIIPQIRYFTAAPLFSITLGEDTHYPDCNTLAMYYNDACIGVITPRSEILFRPCDNLDFNRIMNCLITLQTNTMTLCTVCSLYFPIAGTCCCQCQEIYKRAAFNSLCKWRALKTKLHFNHPETEIPREWKTKMNQLYQN